MSPCAEYVSDDVTRTLRKPPPPHKRKAPVASKRRGRAISGCQAACAALLAARSPLRLVLAVYVVQLSWSISSLHIMERIIEAMASRQYIFFQSAGAIAKPTTNRAGHARNQKYTPVGFLLKNTDCDRS